MKGDFDVDATVPKVNGDVDVDGKGIPMSSEVNENVILMLMQKLKYRW